ncbi:MAG: YbaB/EbfC family nucleoid-associated protein [Pseudomonadota bacterium]
MAKGPYLRGGIPELLRQARRVQEKLEEVKEGLKERTETASVASGKVTATVNGQRRVTAVKIDPSLLKEEDLEMMEDLVTSAINAALEKIDKLIEEETEKVSGGMEIPGLL